MKGFNINIYLMDIHRDPYALMHSIRCNMQMNNRYILTYEFKSTNAYACVCVEEVFKLRNTELNKEKLSTVNGLFKNI